MDLNNYEETYKSFIEFIMSQPDNREIDHSSWGNCAVGDFYASVGIPRYMGDRDYFMITPEWLKQQDPILYKTLISCTNTGELNTYRDLKLFIQMNQ